LSKNISPTYTSIHLTAFLLRYAASARWVGPSVPSIDVV